MIGRGGEHARSDVDKRNRLHAEDNRSRIQLAIIDSPSIVRSKPRCHCPWLMSLFGLSLEHSQETVLAIAS
jgi:hypothetical protein